MRFSPLINGCTQMHAQHNRHTTHLHVALLNYPKQLRRRHSCRAPLGPGLEGLARRTHRELDHLDERVENRAEQFVNTCVLYLLNKHKKTKHTQDLRSSGLWQQVEYIQQRSQLPLPCIGHHAALPDGDTGLHELSGEAQEDALQQVGGVLQQRLAVPLQIEIAAPRGGTLGLHIRSYTSTCMHVCRCIYACGTLVQVHRSTNFQRQCR